MNKHLNMEFAEFVSYMYEEKPTLFDSGHPWETLESYVSPFVDGCDFVGKTENLKEDLAKVLDMAKEGYDSGNLMDREKVNTATVKVTVDDKTRKLIEKKEKGLIERFYAKD